MFDKCASLRVPVGFLCSKKRVSASPYTAERRGCVAHPACGVVHAVHAGDILVVNPAQGHCTSEVGDALATRKMIAILLSRNALRACVTSHEVAVANGLQIWEPQQQLRCKRKR